MYSTVPYIEYILYLQEPLYGQPKQIQNNTISFILLKKEIDILIRLGSIIYVVYLRKLIEAEDSK